VSCKNVAYNVLGVDLGRLSTSWQRSFREEDKIKRTEGADVLALSAFGLSGLPTPLARKQLVKEMWESGADVIVRDASKSAKRMLTAYRCSSITTTSLALITLLRHGNSCFAWAKRK
jgi:hypothetical protein